MSLSRITVVSASQWCSVTGLPTTFQINMHNNKSPSTTIKVLDSCHIIYLQYANIPRETQYTGVAGSTYAANVGAAACMRAVKTRRLTFFHKKRSRDWNPAESAAPDWGRATVCLSTDNLGRHKPAKTQTTAPASSTSPLLRSVVLLQRITWFSESDAHFQRRLRTLQVE